MKNCTCNLPPRPNPIAIAGEARERLARALETLPPRFREVIVLRELEGCSSKEIAAITSIPIGTVMSSLSRARRQGSERDNDPQPNESESSDVSKSEEA